MDGGASGTAEAWSQGRRPARAAGRGVSVHRSGPSLMRGSPGQTPPPPEMVHGGSGNLGEGQQEGFPGSVLPGRHACSGRFSAERSLGGPPAGPRGDQGGHWAGQGAGGPVLSAPRPGCPTPTSPCWHINPISCVYIFNQFLPINPPPIAFASGLTQSLQARGRGGEPLTPDPFIFLPQASIVYASANFLIFLISN